MFLHFPGYAQCNNFADLTNCCNNHRESLENFWPNEDRSCRDSCESITNLANSNQGPDMGSNGALSIVNGCIQKAGEKQQCMKECEPYVTGTTEGCTNSRNAMKEQCQTVCENNTAVKQAWVDRDIGGTGEDFTYYYEIEKVLDRSDCLEEAKRKFVESYTKQCVKKIQEIQGRKKGNTTLLCEKGATKEEPKCTEYCKKRAESGYAGTKGFEKDKMVEWQQGSLDHLGYINSGDIHRYRSVTRRDIDRLTEYTLDEDRTLGLKVHIDPSTAVITSAGTSAGLSWLCTEGTSCEREIANALNKAAKTCSELQKEANECCEQPEQCVGGGLAHALDGLGKLNVAVAGMKGMKEQCEAIQQTHGMYGGMQGLMASRCTKTANACVSECSQAIGQFAEVYKKHCGHDPRNKATWVDGEYTCDKKVFEKYQKEYRSNNADAGVNVSRVPDQCKIVKKEANRRIQDMSTNMATGLLASMEECDRVAKENGWDPVSPDTPTPNNPTNPLAPPPGIGDPPVEVGGGGDEEEESNKFVPPTDGPSGPQAANPFDTEPELGEQMPGVGEGVKGGMAGMLGGSGSGGGLGGIGSGGGGDSGGGGFGGAPGKGKKRKILLGYKGGKFGGYGGGSNSESTREGRRGFRGKKEGRKAASLDLKKLFPKGKQLNHKIGKYGSPHDDIFQRLSDRIQWMCKTDKINCN